MARIRSIKPTVWSDQRFTDLSLNARLLCLGMISNADDDGRIIASGASLIGAIFPHDDLTTKAVEKWRDEIAKTGLAVVYHQGKGTYACFPKFGKHQLIRKHMASTLPAPPTVSALPGAKPDASLDEESRTA